MKIDKGFLPIYEFYVDFQKQVKAAGGGVPLLIALERSKGQIYRFDTLVFDEAAAGQESMDKNVVFSERLIKSLLWIVGGFKLYIHAPKGLFKRLADIFKQKGERAFDVEFMERIFENKFEVVCCQAADMPKATEVSVAIGGGLGGARIGFDAGGSDRKVAAVLDGEVLYSDEIVWHPKLTSDWKYHYEGIKSSIAEAASYLPRVDSIGVSSAGVYIDNRTMVASLFNEVPQDDFKKHIKDIYPNIAKEFNAQVKVANDGDVAALAGAMELEQNCVLGIAMGTSQAGGYIDKNGNITGWLNELAFVPCDMQENGAVDEWSGDKGCGVKYFSQDAVIRLAMAAGIHIEPSLSLYEKLKYIQNIEGEKAEVVDQIFEDIGTYFGNAILYYTLFYDIKYVLLLGRVSSGKGGNIILEQATKILKQNNADIKIELPDEKSRRVGQAVAAARL